MPATLLISPVAGLTGIAVKLEESIKSKTDQEMSIPVIVVSGRDRYGNRDRALYEGARAFVQKPWNDNELLGIIGDLLGQGPAAFSLGASGYFPVA